jgi:hypothetical protein
MRRARKRRVQLAVDRCRCAGIGERRLVTDDGAGDDRGRRASTHSRIDEPGQDAAARTATGTTTATTISPN